MSEINENKLPEKLQALLKDQEKVEHFAKPLKESYESLFQQQIGWVVLRFIITSGFVSYSINA